MHFTIVDIDSVNKGLMKIHSYLLDTVAASSFSNIVSLCSAMPASATVATTMDINIPACSVFCDIRVMVITNLLMLGDVEGLTCSGNNGNKVVRFNLVSFHCVCGAWDGK